MNKLHYILTCVALFLFACFFSCKDDYEDYSTSSNHILSFSTDTLSLDTLLSTVGSSTRKFMIYNKNKKPLLISSIHLSKENGFRINVDGQSGYDFSNIHIGAEDSLYVFVEATLAEASANTPVYIKDEIIFITNNVQQKVILEASVQNVTILKAPVFENSTTLSNERPYLIYDSLVVAENVTLEIPEGTIFYMMAKTGFKVYGTVKAIGTLEHPIIFRGSRTDYLLGISYDLVPGQWDGLWFAASSTGNEFEYVHIRNGMYAINLESSNPDIQKLSIKNSVLTNANGHLLYAENCNIIAENSEFSNASGALAYLTGGQYNFAQCTFANYLPSWVGITTTGNTIILSNYTLDNEGNPVAAPLYSANFQNSIVYGSSTTNAQYIIRQNKEKLPDTAMDYLFQNCLLLKKDGKNDGDTLVNCIFNENPEFIKSKPVKSGQEGIPESQKEYDYVFDFRISSESPARNKADISIAQEYPFDMNGIYRFQDEGPDMGAYEYAE